MHVSPETERIKRGTCRKPKSKMLTVKRNIGNFLDKDEYSRMSPLIGNFIRLEKLVKYKNSFIYITYKVNFSTFY